MARRKPIYDDPGINVTPMLDKRRVALHEVRPLVERTRAENPEGGVVIVADKGARIGMVTQVMDQVRLAGVEGVAIAAEGPDG